MNIFNVPPPKIGEKIDILCAQNGVKIELITSSSKLQSKLYDQSEDEFVLLIEGTAQIEIEGQIQALKKGDTLLIKARQKHRIISCESGSRWLCVYMTPKI